MGTTRTALAAAVILGMAAPAAAADFCGALKSVVADTPRGYAGIRGQPDPKYPQSYWDPLALPGAVPVTGGGAPCFVLHLAKTNPPEEYRCYFPGSATRDAILADMHAMATRVSDCVGPLAFDPKLGVWRVVLNDVIVMVGGVLPPPDIAGGAGAVLIMVEPAPAKKK